MRARFALFIAIVQSILFLGHLIIYGTWIELWDPPRTLAIRAGLTLGFLSLTFVSASIIGFRYTNAAVRAYYRFAAAWLGFINFLVCACVPCWILFGICWLAGQAQLGRPIVLCFFSAAVLVSTYGIVNASRTRVKRISVKLPNLPDAWRGRTGALVSDLHLGHVRSIRFVRKIVGMLSQLQPVAVFIAGDLYDGVAADLISLAKPLSQLTPPFGVYFVAGNHEEFTSASKYLDAVRRAGVLVLNNESASIEGLQVVGVDYRASVNSDCFASILQSAHLDPKRPSILLTHAPHQLEIPERAGISLQLSGHTHHGQLIPAKWVVDRIYGPYAYGLQRFKTMMLYTSCGVGTWGPPMRIGTDPEIVLITFE